MGSFRSPQQRRSRDLATITVADRPLERRDGDGKVVQAEVPPEDWLGEKESITYWKQLPHGAVVRLGAAGIRMVIGRNGRILRRELDTSASLLVRLREGIVDWELWDDEGNPVPWDPEHAEELLNGLPAAVYIYLREHIGRGDSLSLEAVDPTTARKGPDGQLEGPTVGETSAGD